MTGYTVLGYNAKSHLLSNLEDCQVRAGHRVRKRVYNRLRAHESLTVLKIVIEKVLVVAWYSQIERGSKDF